MGWRGLRLLAGPGRWLADAAAADHAANDSRATLHRNAKLLAQHVHRGLVDGPDIAIEGLEQNIGLDALKARIGRVGGWLAADLTRGEAQDLLACQVGQHDVAVLNPAVNVAQFFGRSSQDTMQKRGGLAIEFIGPNPHYAVLIGFDPLRTDAAGAEAIKVALGLGVVVVAALTNARDTLLPRLSLLLGQTLLLALALLRVADGHAR